MKRNDRFDTALENKSIFKSEFSCTTIHGILCIAVPSYDYKKVSQSLINWCVLTFQSKHKLILFHQQR